MPLASHLHLTCGALVVVSLIVETGARAEPAAEVETVPAATLPAPAESAADASTSSAPVSASFEGVGAAVLPGLLVHGTGLWVRGDREGAGTLLKIEGLAAGMAIVSGGLLGATGASRRVANKTIPFFLASSGLFFQSWLADIYGSAGGGRRGSTPRLDDVPLSLEVGGFYVRDPQFDYGPFTRVAATWQRGAFRVAPELVIGLGGNNQRMRARGFYRLWGHQGRRDSGDGSVIEVELGARSHRYGREEFTATSGEIVAHGRLDGRRLGPSMAGSFADMSAGYGVEATRFETGAMVTDTTDTLLYRFAYGMYLGSERSPVRGELSLYYDHRRDDFAGGLSPGDRGGGFFGFFGVGLDLDIGSRFGVLASAELGSAQVFSLALKARFGSEGPR